MKRRFSCSATYATRTGRPGGRTFLVDAPDITAASAIAVKRLSAYSKVDLRVTDITERNQP